MKIIKSILIILCSLMLIACESSLNNDKLIEGETEIESLNDNTEEEETVLEIEERLSGQFAYTASGEEKTSSCSQLNAERVKDTYYTEDLYSYFCLIYLPVEDDCGVNNAAANKFCTDLGFAGLDECQHPPSGLIIKCQ